MKKYKIILPLLIAFLFLGSSFIQKNIPGIQWKNKTAGENKWSGTISHVGSVGTSPDLSIADIGVVEGNAGQRSVDVMVSISQASSDPVTVAYSTRNGTALAGSDYAATNGSVTFAPGDIMKKITLSVNGDVAVETDETFEVVLSNPSGATLTDNIGTATIVNDDFRSGNLSAAHLSVYEVRFTYTGYTTFYGTPADCPIRSNGKVVLSGLLEGAENVPADDDINYSGTLQLDIDIDICSMKGEDDNAKSCGITVTGSGPVKTELEIYYDHRGGYIKVENKSGRFIKNVSGSCDPLQINEERKMVPNRTIASVFNGLELPKLTDRTLRVGRYVESNNGIEIVVEVLRVVVP
jgi:Calx-beta domain